MNNYDKTLKAIDDWLTREYEGIYLKEREENADGNDELETEAF